MYSETKRHRKRVGSEAFTMISFAQKQVAKVDMGDFSDHQLPD